LVGFAAGFKPGMASVGKPSEDSSSVFEAVSFWATCVEPFEPPQPQNIMTTQQTTAEPHQRLTEIITSPSIESYHQVIPDYSGWPQPF
jgi:hypothetical protein